jgi:glycosyltransferase involved in cell wall biosynthesis
MAGGNLVEDPASENMRVRVQLIDPSGDVAPYDHALAAGLAAHGAEVELVTSRFVHGPAAAPEGYTADRRFYRLATRFGAERPALRRALKLAEHTPDMLLYRRHARRADVRHYQWLPLPALDAWLLPPARPRVLTLHNVLRAERLERRLLDRMDALVVHTRAGAELLTGRHGVPPERVRTIPHGAFEHLTRQPDEAPLPEELRAVEGPVVLCFGVVRPYKGVDVLLEAFRDVDAELWVVGRPLGESMERLRRLAPPGRVRFVPRYVSDRELPAYFRRADLLVLPHRRVDVSGVLFAGLAFGKPMLLTDVGGFRDVAHEHGAARLVPPEDPEALGAAIRALLDDPAAREALGRQAQAAADGPYSWQRIAGETLDLYRELTA